MSVLSFKNSELDSYGADAVLRCYAQHKKKIAMPGFTASYLECGSGTPIVFIHGCLTTSVTWRNVVSILSERYHCVVPENLGVCDSRLVGSDNPVDYGFQAQRAYTDAFLEEKFPDQSVILVVQGSGTILGCDWAYRNQHRVQGIVHTSGIFFNAQDFNMVKAVFWWCKKLCNSLCEDREQVRKFFEHWSGRHFSAGELREYERPFMDEASRATCNHLQLMLDDSGEDAIFAQIACNTSWLTNTNIPKLMINAKKANPFIIDAAKVASAFPNQTTLDYQARYLIQEDVPEMFAEDLDRWVQSLTTS